MTSELSDLIWGRLGLSAVRAVPLEEPRAPSAEAAVTELRPRGTAWTRELRLRPLPGQQVFTIDAMRLLVDRLQDLLAIRLPFLAKVSFQILLPPPREAAGRSCPRPWPRRRPSGTLRTRTTAASCGASSPTASGSRGSPGRSGKRPRAARAPSSTPSWPAAEDAAPRAGSPLWPTRGWTSQACRQLRRHRGLRAPQRRAGGGLRLRVAADPVDGRAGVLPRPPAQRPERHGRRPAHRAASPAQRPLQPDPQLPGAGQQTRADPGSHAHQRRRLQGVQVPKAHGPLHQEGLVAAAPRHPGKRRCPGPRRACCATGARPPQSSRP